MSALQVVYSVPARLGGSGIGTTAGQAVAGIYQAGALRQVFASSNAQSAIPAGLIRQWGWFGRAVKYAEAKIPHEAASRAGDRAFDAWAAARLPLANAFHGWNGACLRSLGAAKRQGMTTVVERASSHPASQVALLEEEHRRWGIAWRPSRRNVTALLQELDAADYITIPSPYARQTMIAAGVPEGKLIEIPFGADLERFQPANEPAPRPFRALFAGQVSLRKGLPYLLEAWHQLRWRDAELWIVGAETPETRPILARWSDLAGVRLIAHTPGMAELMRQCDLFVFPSLEEGSALVTYEALACGLPVVTTPNAGSVVRHEREGFIVPIRDAPALAEALRRLRDDTELRAEMSRAARVRAGEYPWSRYQAGLVAAYRRIADG